MIEQQLEERFRLAVADEPPLGFDPDDIVDRASRRQRNRRAVAAVVAAVAVVTTATTITFAAGQSADPVADQQTHQCLTSEQEIGRVDQRVRQALAEHLPGIKFADSGNVIAGLPTGETCGLFSHNKRAGEVTPLVEIGLNYVPPPDNADTYADHPWYEGTRKRLPDGSELGTYQLLAELADQYPSQQVAAVVHVRPDGMTIVASTTDLKAVSIAELTALATDPELTF